jgi:hypothetical protein
VCNKFDHKRNPSINRDLGRREADRQDDTADQRTIEDRLDGVMSKGRSNIKVRVRVVDGMERSPQ